MRDCAYGLARYAAIAQDAGLVPIVEPEVLLDGEHDIDACMEVQQRIWAETFKYMADNNVSASSQWPPSASSNGRSLLCAWLPPSCSSNAACAAAAAATDCCCCDGTAMDITSN